MNNTMAKISAIASVVLILGTALLLWVTSHPGAGDTMVKAEFEDAFPILAGMNVRVNGAVAGSVREVEVTDRGTAMVTVSLNEGTAPPRSDAAASIRQQDVTGDSYLSLSTGEDPDELGDEVIPVERTLVTPRFDDLLNAFAEPEREALRLILVEAGKALERRGSDVNAAALQLRPALVAIDEALAEVGSQNRALGQLVADAEQVTGQTAGRSAELAEMINSLSVVLSTTADHGDSLDAALADLPETAVQAQETLSRLRRTSVAATPLAQAVGRGAPGLANALRLAPRFLGDSRASLKTLSPTVVKTSDLLRDARPTLVASPKRSLTAPFDLAEGVGDLLRVLLANEPVLQTLFGADGYGVPPANAGDVGLAAVAVEGGDQAGYPGNDPNRRFLRALAIPSCELFGLPIAPGCLNDAILNLRAADRRAARRGTQNPGAPGTPGAPAPQVPGLDPMPGEGDDPAKPLVPGAPQVPGLPALPLPGQGAQPPAPAPQDIGGLLDFLLGS